MVLPDPPVFRPPIDQFIVLEGVTWADYQRHLEIRGESSVPRLTYLEGRLEIMSPSNPHERIKSAIGRLLEVWCMKRGIEFTTCGSWTLEDKEAERGAEPDECYLFGAVDEPVRPDLAIEVVWTSGGISKLEVYRGLGVGEVWFWKGGAIEPYVLEDGDYRATPTSRVLPDIDLAQLVAFIDRPTTSQAIRDYRAALDR